jgi:hypothetical protein
MVVAFNLISMALYGSFLSQEYYSVQSERSDPKHWIDQLFGFVQCAWVVYPLISPAGVLR